jgi:ribonuclease BN (tRNA processing enzyme)
MNASQTAAVLANLEACWISHPHADHHLGLPTLLTERKKATSRPLLLMAPWPILRCVGLKKQGFKVAFECVSLLIS